MQARSVKCVVVGDGAVGKTSLMISFTQKQFPCEYMPTSFEFYAANVTVDGISVPLDLWDTAGQEDHANIREQISYPEADVIILCFSIANRSSYENAEHKWAEEIKRNGANKPIILVGTKSDLRGVSNLEFKKYSRPVVSNSEGTALASKIKAVTYMECSSYNQENVDSVFNTAVKAAIEDRLQKMADDRRRKSSASLRHSWPQANKGVEECIIL